jgi:hypothetical protein
VLRLRIGVVLLGAQRAGHQCAHLVARVVDGGGVVQTTGNSSSVTGGAWARRVGRAQPKAEVLEALLGARYDLEPLRLRQHIDASHERDTNARLLHSGACDEVGHD